MAVKASSNITLYHVIDVASVTIYYLLQSSTANPPAKPTTDNPGGNWTTTEPTYTEGSTNTLYTVTKTKYSDGTFEYTPVSKSSSYEAAKSAYNKALNAETTVNNLQIGARNYVLNSANLIINNLNAQSGSRKEYDALNVGQSYMNIEDGTQVTISFDLEMIVGTANPQISVYNTNNKGPKTFDSKTLYFTAAVGSTIEKRVYVTTIIRDRNDATVTNNYMEFYSIYGTNNFFKITNIKLEKGNKATDWTPAPEDVEDAILTVDEKRDYIVGSQTAATRFWTGVSNFTSLKDGQEIIYWLPYATAYTNAGDKTVGVDMRVNSSTTKTAGTTIISFETGTSTNVVWLNLTLKGGNSTGWIPCYYGGTSRLTSHYGAGNSIHLVYRVNAKIGGEAATSQYTGWFADANYVDGNNTDRLRFQNNIKTNKQYVWNSRVLVSDVNGYFPLHGGVTFDRDKPILWAGSNLGPWVNTSSNNNYIAYPSWDMRYNAYQYFASNTWNNGTVFDLINADIPSGKKIYSGTAITGTSTTATIFSGSGISSAAVDDRYINTSTGYYYKCTVAGAASAAKWVYEGDSRIPAGSRVYYGTHLTHTDGTSKNTATAITSAAVGDRYINQNTGRLYECDTAGASGTAKWKDRGVWLQNNKTVYLICNQHGQYLTVDKDGFTTEPPTEEDGKVYIAIGLSYAIYACGLFPEHPMFMYKDNAFKSLEQITYDSSEKAKEAYTAATNAKTRIDSFLDGDDDHSFSAYKRSVTSEISTETGKIKTNFSTYMKESSYGSTLDHAEEFLAKVDSYINMSTNSQGQPYIELGVQPNESIPNTYRLRIENDEIYMVYGSGETETLTKLTSWSTKNGKSNFEVNTLVTQQEMAIEPFRFIKNDDGSLSFRKVE